MKPHRIYPGLIDADVEIFNTKDGVKIMSNGIVYDFNHLPMPLYQKIKEVMHSHPEALEVLNQWHPDSELKQIETFAKCRFGGLDFTPDISNDVIQDGEYWDCPLRGVCKGEGKVCRPLTYKDQTLSAMEILMMRLLSTNMTNEVVAMEIQKPLGTLHKAKALLYKKLGNIQTKQELADISRNLNLI